MWNVNYFQSIISPSDTRAVAYAKQKHLSAFEKIAAEHAKIAEERRIADELKEQENQGGEVNEHYWSIHTCEEILSWSKQHIFWSIIILFIFLKFIKQIGKYIKCL